MVEQIDIMIFLHLMFFLCVYILFTSSKFLPNFIVWKRGYPIVKFINICIKKIHCAFTDDLPFIFDCHVINNYCIQCILCFFYYNSSGNIARSQGLRNYFFMILLLFCVTVTILLLLCVTVEYKGGMVKLQRVYLRPRIA